MKIPEKFPGRYLNQPASEAIIGIVSTINSLIDVVHEQEILIIDIRKDIWAQQVEISQLNGAVNEITKALLQRGYIVVRPDDKEETK